MLSQLTGGDPSLLTGLHDQYIRTTASLLATTLATQPTARVVLLSRDVGFSVLSPDPRVRVMRFTQLQLTPGGLYRQVFGMDHAPEGAVVEGNKGEEGIIGQGEKTTGGETAGEVEVGGVKGGGGGGSAVALLLVRD